MLADAKGMWRDKIDHLNKVSAKIIHLMQTQQNSAIFELLHDNCSMEMVSDNLSITVGVLNQRFKQYHQAIKAKDLS